MWGGVPMIPLHAPLVLSNETTYMVCSKVTKKLKGGKGKVGKGHGKGKKFLSKAKSKAPTPEPKPEVKPDAKPEAKSGPPKPEAKPEVKKKLEAKPDAPKTLAKASGSIAGIADNWVRYPYREFGHLVLNKADNSVSAHCPVYGSRCRLPKTLKKKGLGYLLRFLELSVSKDYGEGAKYAADHMNMK